MRIPSRHGSHISSLELQASRFRCGAVKSNFLLAVKATLATTGMIVHMHVNERSSSSQVLHYAGRASVHFSAFCLIRFMISSLKSSLLVFLFLLSPANLSAQSSHDYWDKRFHTEKYQARQQERIRDWFKSWNTRRCEADDIKKYWLLTLLEPFPDRLDGLYNAIVRKNAQLTEAINLGAWDFEAQDVADQLNIAVLRSKNKEAEATAVEQFRIQRRAIFEQRLQADRALSEQIRSNAIIATELRRLSDNVLILGLKMR